MQGLFKQHFFFNSFNSFNSFIKIVFFAFLILLQGCHYEEEVEVTASVSASTTTHSPSNTFSQDRYYYHPIYSSAAECNAALRFGLNCDQWATFYRDGVAELVVSDIIHRGYYSIQGNLIYVTLSPNHEIPTRITFEISHDGSYITDSYYNVTWYID